MTPDDEQAMEAGLPPTAGGQAAAYRAGYRDCHAREAAKRERLVRAALRAADMLTWTDVELEAQAELRAALKEVEGDG